MLRNFGVEIQTKGATHFDPGVEERCKLRKSTRHHVFGYWQNERYFEKHALKIRQDLRPSPSRELLNGPLQKQISETNSVCIHARRLFGMPNSQMPHGSRDSKYPTLSPEYYRRAISQIKSKISNPFFYCFSDEPSWLEANFASLGSHVIIQSSSGRRNEIDDLYLMSQCKHFIIANSTYSWWAAWLGAYPQKAVFAPNPTVYFGAAEPSSGWHVSV